MSYYYFKVFWFSLYDTGFKSNKGNVLILQQWELDIIFVQSMKTFNVYFCPTFVCKGSQSPCFISSTFALILLILDSVCTADMLRFESVIG